MRKTFFGLAAVAILAITTNAVAADPTDKNDVPEFGQEFSDKLADVISRDRTEPLYVPTADQIEVQIKSNNLKPDEVFFEQLAIRVQHQAFVEEFIAEDNFVGRIDLNGDGRDELIVYFNNSYFCGTAPECDVSIYHHDGKQWRYVGEMTSIHGNVVYFRDKQHNGWRVSQYNESSSCWVTPAEIHDFYKKANMNFEDYGPIARSDNGIGQKIDPNFGGYLYLPGKEPCWHLDY